MSNEPAADGRDLSRMWQAVLGRLEIELGPHNYETWFRGSRALRLDDACLIVEAANAFNLDWMNGELRTCTERALARAAGEELGVRFVARTAGGCRGDARAPSRRAASILGSFNARYTFERYLEAEGNRLARRSCAALLANEPWAGSPLVVFGAPGMGKTHLLHAMAAHASARGESVACLSAEEFTSRYQGALRQNGIDRFQADLRSVRLLLVDDLQYVAGKKGTQAEFVHTLDAVTNAGGAAVIASERHPADLDLEDRLVSRLQAGIVARVAPFCLDERRRFIEYLAREVRVSLPAWAVERIAGLEVPSVRVLQGAVHAAVGLASCEMLDPRRLDAELTRLSLAAAAPTLTDEHILHAAAAHFATTAADLAGKSRKADVAAARAAAAAALRGRGRSLAEIATTLHRDRSTVRDLAERGQALIAADAALRARLAG